MCPRFHQFQCYGYVMILGTLSFIYILEILWIGQMCDFIEK